MPVIEVWRVSKIIKHRDKYNKVGKNHYSFRDWEMYARKVPLLQVLKYMPASIELANAIAVSHASESGRGVTIENGIVIDTDTHGAENIDTTTGEIVNEKQVDEKKVEQKKAGTKQKETQAKTSYEPTADEQEKIQQQLIDEENSERIRVTKESGRFVGDVE